MLYYPALESSACVPESKVQSELPDSQWEAETINVRYWEMEVMYWGNPMETQCLLLNEVFIFLSCC